MFQLYWYYTVILKNTFETHSPHVVAATVDDEAIQCCSFLQVDGKEEGEGLSTAVHPSQTSRHWCLARHAEVASHGLCSSLGSTPDLLSPMINTVTGRKTN